MDVRCKCESGRGKHTHTHTHSLSLSLSLSHTHTHTHTLSLSLSFTLYLSHLLSFTHANTHANTHSHTCTLPHSLRLPSLVTCSAAAHGQEWFATRAQSAREHPSWRVRLGEAWTACVWTGMSWEVFGQPWYQHLRDANGWCSTQGPLLWTCPGCQRGCFPQRRCHLCGRPGFRCRR